MKDSEWVTFKQGGFWALPSFNPAAVNGGSQWLSDMFSLASYL
jgi:hypothetical protein